MDSSYCRLCMENNAYLLCNLGAMALFKCSNCGAVFREDDLAKPVEEYYDRDYYEGEFRNYFRSKKRVELYRRWLDRIEIFANAGKWLDVGCGLGTFLDMVSKTGHWDVYGSDISDYAVDYAYKNYNLRHVRKGELFELSFPDNFFDVITMIDVIEHAKDPVKLICEAFRILKPNGVIFITTINEESFINDIAGFLYWATLGLYKKPFLKLHHTDIIFYFWKKPLKFMLNKCKLQLLDMALYEMPPEAMRGSRMLKEFIFFLARILKRENRVLTIVRKRQK